MQTQHYFFSKLSGPLVFTCLICWALDIKFIPQFNWSGHSAVVIKNQTGAMRIGETELLGMVFFTKVSVSGI